MLIDRRIHARYFLMFAVNICLGQGPSVARWPIGQYPQRSMAISNPVVDGIKRPILTALHWMTRSISHRPMDRNSRRLETLHRSSGTLASSSGISLKLVLDDTRVVERKIDETLGVAFQLVYLNFSFGAKFFFTRRSADDSIGPSRADHFCPFESDIWRRRLL